MTPFRQSENVIML